ncbi:MAG TPA: DAK2 domain-containing protein [Gaiellaceae bacterium]|nr:DAK2 domain-containing protein [Gaiellaceae bacterium]
MSAAADIDRVRAVVGSALSSLEASRARIDDLNVYPVPDGDTGTNLTLTVRAVAEALGDSEAADRPALAHEVARAALMGARGNSGVILSQIVRGAADVLAESANGVEPKLAARALRGASDAAYSAVRRPVEGTMLSVVRELAEEAESRADDPAPLGELLVDLVRRGEDAVARTPEQLEVLREAGVVDAGGAGLVELLRGVAAAVSGEPVPEAPAVATERAGLDAIHLEQSRYRYCTVFVVEGEGLDRDALEAQLERLGDSLLVVGDDSALKVHVHTDDPGAALSLGTAAGTIEGIEIANMQVQQEERERRLSVVPDPVERAVCGVVAVVAGEGNRGLFESVAEPVGPIRIVAGGQTANPSTAELLAAIEQLPADEVILLPNNSNVRLAAEHAARSAGRPVEVVATDSITAGLAALVAFDGSRTAAENAAEMRETVAAVAAGEVTRASRDVQLNGVAIRNGEWLGLADGDPVAGGDDFVDVTLAVIERLLSEPRSLLTLLTGAEPQPLDGLVDRIAAAYPEVEIEVHEGGQPHYPLLLGAE